MFRPLTEEEKIEIAPPCFSHEHNPPDMMVLPAGLHVWVCPACRQETKFVVPGITC
jgi:hypothetical protein